MQINLGLRCNSDPRCLSGTSFSLDAALPPQGLHTLLSFESSLRLLMEMWSPLLLLRWQPTALHPEPVRQMIWCPNWRAETLGSLCSPRPRRQTKEVNARDIYSNHCIIIVADWRPEPQGKGTFPTLEQESFSLNIYLYLIKEKCEMWPLEASLQRFNGVRVKASRKCITKCIKMSCCTYNERTYKNTCHASCANHQRMWLIMLLIWIFYYYYVL